MVEHKYFKDDRWNKSDFTYTFETGSKIEFFSADMPSKVRGPRRDRLFMNEANNLPYETFDQLEVRTKEFIYLDYNPTNEFWFYDKVQGVRDDVDHIIITYKDNEALDSEIVKSIEQRKANKAWWQVYGLGLLGEVETRIYKQWQIIDEIPHEARLEVTGLDYGYTNDPSAAVDIYSYNGGYIWDEVTYAKGLSNKQISDVLLNKEKRCPVAPDSAEPKSNDELRSYGLTVMDVIKGQGSVLQGIQFVQGQQISVTKRSLNVIKEYRNYIWITDKNGKILNEPDHLFSHCFAPESLVYTTKGKFKISELVGKEGYLYTRDGGVERYYNVRPTRKNTEVLSLKFDDGDILTLTPDHLLLQTDGTWKQAQLINVGDLIQSHGYKNTVKKSTDILGESIYSIQGHKILQRLSELQKILFAQSSLGISSWSYTKGLSYSSQGSQSSEQFSSESRDEAYQRSLRGSYDTRTQSQTKVDSRQDQTTYQNMAWIKRGNSVAQFAWQNDIPEKKTNKKELLSLPHRILNDSIQFISKVLSPKLQDESKTKKVTGITGGFRAQTYNLEVENTHCLLVNGVIAHNSMDAGRYGMSTLNTRSELSKEELLERRQMRARNLIHQSR